MEKIRGGREGGVYGSTTYLSQERSDRGKIRSLGKIYKDKSNDNVLYVENKTSIERYR